MSTDTIRDTIPEFVDARTEAAYRVWVAPDTVRQARAALWVAVFAIPAFVVNDLMLLGAAAAAVQAALRAVVTVWSALLLVRLRRPIDVNSLDRHLLAWAIAVDFQATAAAASRPPDFAPSLMVAQTILYSLVVFWPLRVVPRMLNGAGLAVALIVLLRWAGAVTPTMVLPLSIAMLFALAIGLPLVLHVERLRRQEFARMRREKIQMDELREAKEAAEAADHAKTRFLAIVSHEVRTPMNGVLGVLQLMESSRLDALQRRQIDIARDCAESLTSLLDTIIDYARLGNTVETSVPVDFDPRLLVQSVVELLRPRATAQQTVVQVQIDGSVPVALHADASRLRQVLVNLLSNAVKFTENGRITVRLALHCGETDSPSLGLTVDDNGIGIPPDKLGRIFDEFAQADESIARRFGGAGLGLAVCKRVVSLLGGTISVSSEPGAGSGFYVTAPVAVASVATAASAATAATKRLKVLVVDDDPINLVVTCGLLAQLGHDGTPAPSGEAALVELAQEAFDVVFMDLHMPQMDGFETIHRIRALAASNRASVPVIALTADMLLTQDARFSELGLCGVLPKPLRRDAMSRALAAVSANVVEAPARPDRTWSSDASVDLVLLSEQVDALGIATVARLVHMFRQAGRQMLGDLEAALADDDSDRVEALAHRLGSSASALGLARLSRLADRVEQAAVRRSGSPELVPLMEALATEFRRAFNALRCLVNEARSAQAAHQAPQLTLTSSR